MPTRTLKIASSRPAAGVNTTVLTVPADTTFILKSVLVFNELGATDTVYVLAKDASTNQGPVFYQVSLPVLSRLEWNGWLVLGPGDQLVVTSITGNSVFWVSGAKLPGAA